MAGILKAPVEILNGGVIMTPVRTDRNLNTGQALNARCKCVNGVKLKLENTQRMKMVEFPLRNSRGDRENEKLTSN